VVKFDLPEVKFNPEIDEVPINPYRLKKIIEDVNLYNKDSRLWKQYEAGGEEIPMQYRGRNRYWLTVGEGQDAKYGPYTVVSLYDLDPQEKTLICKYKIVREATKTLTGKELEEVPLQTLAQAEKYVKAARLEAERQERMAKKDPKLTSEIKAHIPLMMAPDAARKRIDARLNPK